MPDGRGVATLKALILTFAALLFLAPLATRPGLVFGLLGTFAGALLAYQLAGSRLRLVGGLAVGGAVALVGSLVDRVLVSWASFLDPSFTLQVADVFAFGLGALGVSFVICLLSRRVRGFAVLELVLVVAAVGHTFSEHRHQRIHQPRFLSDWAWSNGVDPQVMLTAVGVLAVALAAVLLLRARRGAWLLGMLLLLVLLFGATAAVLAPEHLGGAADTNDLGLTKDDEKKNDQDKKDGNGNGGGGSSNKPPDPVAIVLLQDDLPDVRLLYFRQAVRSRLVGDKLSRTTSGGSTHDVPTGVPLAGPVKLSRRRRRGCTRRSTPRCSCSSTTRSARPGRIPTSCAAREPDPRRFVAVYDVKSQLLLRPPERLLGRSAGARVVDRGAARALPGRAQRPALPRAVGPARARGRPALRGRRRDEGDRHQAVPGEERLLQPQAEAARRRHADGQVPLRRPEGLLRALRARGGVPAAQPGHAGAGGARLRRADAARGAGSAVLIYGRTRTPGPSSISTAWVG
jgi:hypothetical protein